MMALHCNLNRDPQQTPEPYTAQDFMNYVVGLDDEAEMTDEEIESYAAYVFGV